MDPFMLRRKKDAVLTDLPPKRHIVTLCDLSPAQQVAYDSMVTAFKKTLLSDAGVVEGASAVENGSSGGQGMVTDVRLLYVQINLANCAGPCALRRCTLYTLLVYA
jgi:hypothetical protein